MLRSASVNKSCDVADGCLTPRHRASVSIPREMSHTPAIASVSSNMHTPFIQKCCVREEDVGENQKQQQHHTGRITVYFENDKMELTTTSLLGKGGFGRVYAAQSNGGELYALKVSSKEMTDADWERLRREVSLMSHFSRHPNVVKLVAAGRDKDFAYVAMECCASRSLHDIIANNGLELPEILWIGWALVDTIAFLHAKGCIHRDLKPQNLLFDFDGNLKISDFGLSNSITQAQPRKTVAGTAIYMAPEMAEAVYKRITKSEPLSSLRYGQEIDTWSIGVVLYVMLTRMNPYSQAMEKERFHEMGKEEKKVALFSAVAAAGWKWPKGWKGDEGLCDIVNKTLHHDRAKRATLQEILQHPTWNRRPLTCPISLLQKLNLLARTSSTPRHSLSRGSLSRAQENLPSSYVTKTTEAFLAESLNRVILVEERARAQLALEYHEALYLILEMLKISKGDIDRRETIIAQEKRHRASIESKISAKIDKLISEAAVRPVDNSKGTSEDGGTASSARSRREPSIMLAAPFAGDGKTKKEVEIIRRTPEKYAIVYSGRNTATRWSLRSVISLPRELNEEIEQFRCMNNHVLKKLTSMPIGYEGFDCNVCDSAVLNVSSASPVFRCYKCDYDVCVECTFSRRVKDVNFICVSCAKKFTSSEKLHSHSLKCRGPSVSPSPRASSRRNTMVWDKPGSGTGSLLDINLPTETPPRVSSRVSGRISGVRASSGGRISVGDSYVQLPEDVGKMVVKHRDATFPDVNELTTRGNRSVRASLGERKRSVSSARHSFSFELPPEVRLSGHSRGNKVQPRNSAELTDIIGISSPPRKKSRTDVQDENKSERHSKGSDEGEAVDTAVRPRAEREAKAVQNRDEGKESRSYVEIHASSATRPPDTRKQSHVPRSVSSRRPAGRAPTPGIDTMTVMAAKAPAIEKPPIALNIGQFTSRTMRQPSVTSGALFGGPPLPRRPDGTSCSMPRAMAYISTRLGSAPRSQPSQCLGRPAVPMQLVSPAGMAPPSAKNNTENVNNRPASVIGPRSGGKAFLALPRGEEQRMRFVDEFLSGAWVRFYSFTTDDVVAMYYSLQPGRYGAFFATEQGVGTAVVDVHSKLVLYVPCMDKDSMNRIQPHPHVLTYFEEDVQLLNISDAQKVLGSVLTGIMNFVQEIARQRGEGLPPPAVHAAYLHERDKTAVPSNTKFAYVRKVFPDPSGSFVLFRLSNLRSQVICNVLMDIRWQSDRQNNVGQRYYVLADGTAEPFTVDHTGILFEVDQVVRNNFRR